MSTKTNKAPTDLDLMLYADGELDGDERVAVEAWLLRDEAARSKLVAMGMVAGMVREKAHAQAAAADGIADLVMAAVANEPKPEAALASRRSGELVALPHRPANDNTRGLWAVAAIAVAAAAGMLLWAGAPPSTKGTTAVASAPPIGITATAQREDAPKGDAEVEHGVEVAAVDFGSLTGAVFYVPSASAASSTTTVVWLADNSSGGNE